MRSRSFLALPPEWDQGWGGNVYEDDAFFDICDRNGIMVWQDFSMACAIYPQTPEFLDVMRQEATSVVRRLRDHPSLALWSGDNEVDESYLSSGLDPAHNKITREVLPQVVFQCDPYRPYLPSSPYMSPEVIATGLGGSCQKSICGARETTSEALLSIIDCTGLELTWLCKGNYSATPTFKLR